MSSVDVSKARQATAARPQSAAATYAVALFSSALLLFLVQPMFAKMALPRLGGTAAVWSLALVFFQLMLLLGYGYAHLLAKTLSLRTGAMLHVVVLAGAVASLPIGITAAWRQPPDEGQALWLMALFAASVGMPFFAMSANAPLLQSWFSRSGHAQSGDPYFLYGASNAGSFTALLAYPIVIEPFLGLRLQSILWSFGYAILIAMVAGCGWLAIRSATVGAPPRDIDVPGDRTTFKDRMTWIALSFVPSGLLVGITAHIATDLVSAPFMWVVPLALYLLTFVITFQTKPLISHGFVIRRLGLIIAPLCLFTLSPATNLWLVPLHLLGVFALTMACHGELARLRPHTRRLTEFYLLMSLGGVLGGMFASLLAPVLFSSVLEYPLLLVAGFFVIGMVRRSEHSLGVGEAMALVAVPLAFVFASLSQDGATSDKNTMLLIWMLTALGCLLMFHRQLVAQAAILLSVVIIYDTVSQVPPPLVQLRSFYGVLAVYPVQNGRIHMLAHGTTKHGSQVRKDESGLRVTTSTEPQSYYYAKGPFGSIIGHLRKDGAALGQVAVVGLGTGAMACHALADERWDFFEIDPDVLRIAQDPAYFTYLRDCGQNVRVIMGDGRLRMEDQPQASYDLIVLDAFSSDSVPAHLMTVEALDLYLSRLKPGGAVVFHISNRFMDLSGVVEAAAQTKGLEVYYNSLDNAYWNPDSSRLDMRPHLAVIGKTPDVLRHLSEDPAWHRAPAKALPAAWTDDYSNVFDAIRRKVMGSKPY